MPGRSGVLQSLRKLLSPRWEREYVVEVDAGKHRYRDRELARASYGLYLYAGDRVTFSKQWVKVTDDE